MTRHKASPDRQRYQITRQEFHDSGGSTTPGQYREHVRVETRDGVRGRWSYWRTHDPGARLW